MSQSNDEIGAPLIDLVLECDQDSSLNDSFSTLGVHSIFSEVGLHTAKKKHEQEKANQKKKRSSRAALEKFLEEEETSTCQDEMDLRTLLRKGSQIDEAKAKQRCWHESFNLGEEKHPRFQGNRWLESAGKSVSCRNFGYDASEKSCEEIVSDAIEVMGSRPVSPPPMAVSGYSTQNRKEAALQRAQEELKRQEAKLAKQKAKLAKQKDHTSYMLGRKSAKDDIDESLPRRSPTKCKRNRWTSGAGLSQSCSHLDAKELDSQPVDVAPLSPNGATARALKSRRKRNSITDKRMPPPPLDAPSQSTLTEDHNSGESLLSKSHTICRRNLWTSGMGMSQSCRHFSVREEESKPADAVAPLLPNGATARAANSPRKQNSITDIWVPSPPLDVSGQSTLSEEDDVRESLPSRSPVTSRRNRWASGAGMSQSCRHFSVRERESTTVDVAPLSDASGQSNLSEHDDIDESMPSRSPTICRRNRWTSGDGMSQSCRHFSVRERESNTADVTMLPKASFPEKRKTMLSMGKPLSSRNLDVDTSPVDPKRLMMMKSKSVRHFSAREREEEGSGLPASPMKPTRRLSMKSKSVRHLSASEREEDVLPSSPLKIKKAVVQREGPQTQATFNGRKFLSYSRSLSCKNLGRNELNTSKNVSPKDSGPPPKRFGGHRRNKTFNCGTTTRAPSLASFLEKRVENERLSAAVKQAPCNRRSLLTGGRSMSARHMVDGRRSMLSVGRSLSARNLIDSCEDGGDLPQLAPISDSRAPSTDLSVCQEESSTIQQETSTIQEESSTIREESSTNEMDDSMPGLSPMSLMKPSVSKVRSLPLSSLPVVEENGPGQAISSPPLTSGDLSACQEESSCNEMDDSMPGLSVMTPMTPMKPSVGTARGNSQEEFSCIEMDESLPSLSPLTPMTPRMPPANTAGTLPSSSLVEEKGADQNVSYPPLSGGESTAMPVMVAAESETTAEEEIDSDDSPESKPVEEGKPVFSTEEIRKEIGSILSTIQEDGAESRMTSRRAQSCRRLSATEEAGHKSLGASSLHDTKSSLKAALVKSAQPPSPDHGKKSPRKDRPSSLRSSHHGKHTSLSRAKSHDESNSSLSMSRHGKRSSLSSRGKCKSHGEHNISVRKSSVDEKTSSLKAALHDNKPSSLKAALNKSSHQGKSSSGHRLLPSNKQRSSRHVVKKDEGQRSSRNLTKKDSQGSSRNLTKKDSQGSSRYLTKKDSQGLSVSVHGSGSRQRTTGGNPEKKSTGSTSRRSSKSARKTRTRSVSRQASEQKEYSQEMNASSPCSTSTRSHRKLRQKPSRKPSVDRTLDSSLSTSSRRLMKTEGSKRDVMKTEGSKRDKPRSSRNLKESARPEKESRPESPNCVTKYSDGEKQSLSPSQEKKIKGVLRRKRSSLTSSISSEKELEGLNNLYRKRSEERLGTSLRDLGGLNELYRERCEKMNCSWSTTDFSKNVVW